MGESGGGNTYTMTLPHAVRLAAAWHSQQLDKAGQPYILHLMRVCLAVDREFQIPAMLHDIVEDTQCKLLELEFEGVDVQDLNTIHLLTRDREETYGEYIQRIVDSGDLGALRIKEADLLDHLSHPIESLEGRYRDALDQVQGALMEVLAQVPLS